MADLATEMQVCGHCNVGSPLVAFPPSVRGSSGGWCRSCYREEKRRKLGVVVRSDIKCRHCGSLFDSAFRKAMFCSRVCKDRAHKDALLVAREQSKPERSCRHCGADMPRSMRSDAAYCSPECNSRAHGLKRGNGRIGPGRRRDIDRVYIIARDGGRCHLCGKKPKGSELTIDHLIPLARGGTHTSENLRVACLSCNCSKGSRSANEQLMAFG